MLATSQCGRRRYLLGKQDKQCDNQRGTMSTYWPLLTALSFVLKVTCHDAGLFLVQLHTRWH